MKLFLSYSHADAGALKKLHKHLAQLRRLGTIETWYDRNILAGSELNDEIEEQLETCECFIALVSNDYIDSHYCFEKETKRALERNAEGKMIIVPIIVRPCVWSNTPLIKFKALPDDGVPIVEWAHEDRAYTRIVEELIRLIEAHKSRHLQSGPKKVVERSGKQTSRFRVRKDFDDIDKDEFRTVAFSSIVHFFEQEFSGLNEEPYLKARLRRIADDGIGCTVINSAARLTAHLTVYQGGGGREFGFADISFSFSEMAPRNTANGWFSIESDGYELYLEDHSMNVYGEQGRITPEVAAHRLFTDLLKRAGVEHAS